MPTYKITAPDGNSYNVTAPDDATQEQVLAYAQANYKHPAVESGATHSADFSDVQGGALPDATLSTLDRLKGLAGKAYGYEQNAGDALVHNAANSLIGPAQSVAHMYQGLVDSAPSAPAGTMLGDASRAMRGYVDRGVNKLDTAIKNREEAYQAAVPTNAASIAGAAAGQALPFLVEAPAKAVGALGEGAAKAIPYVGNIGRKLISGATQGAVVSQLQPVTTGPQGSSLGNLITGENAPSFAQQKLQQAMSGAAAGAGGQAITSTLGNIGSRLAPDLNSAKAKGIQVLKDAGVPLHLSQVTDSKLAKAVGSAASYLPFSGASAAREAQQTAFNRALSNTIGQDSPKLSEPVIAKAKADIGKQYDDLFARNTVNIDGPAAASLTSIANQASKDLPAANARVLHNQVDKFIDAAVKNNGMIPGKTYQNIRKSLQQIEGDQTHGYLVRQLRNEMENVAGRSFAPGDAQALADLNAKYNNLKVIQKALGRVGGSADDVDPSKLWSLVNGKYGSTPRMRALAKAGQNVLKDPIPDSGTAMRNVIYGSLGLGGAALHPAGIPTIVGGAALGATAGRALNSNALANAYGNIDGSLFNAASNATSRLPVIAPAVIKTKKKDRR